MAEALVQRRADNLAGKLVQEPNELARLVKGLINQRYALQDDDLAVGPDDDPASITVLTNLIQHSVRVAATIAEASGRQRYKVRQEAVSRETEARS